MRIESKSVQDTLRIGKSIAGYLKVGDILCLFGELGSGKTALTKGIGSGLKVKKEKIISPSFVLIREYQGRSFPLYHFDLYRLNDPQAILELGYEEYLYSDGATVIEWADRLGSLLPRDFLKIEFSIGSGSKRSLNLTAFGRRYIELLKKLAEQ